MIKGIDVSQWQSIIDWQTLDNDKEIKYVFIRSNDGLVEDTMFARNWSEARKTLLYVSRYLAFYSYIDPITQAELFVNKTPINELDLPLVVDVEVRGNNLEENLKICLNKIEELAGHKPIIYTAKWFWDTEIKDKSYFQRYDLWVANYTNGYENINPILPLGWDNWKFWQYSSTSRINGITTDVDMNVFNGNMEDLNKYIMELNTNDGTLQKIESQLILPPDDTHTGQNYLDLDIIRSWKQNGVNPTKSQLIALIDWFEAELNQNQSVLIIQGKDFKINKENIIRLLEEKLENYDLATFEVSKQKRTYGEEFPNSLPNENGEVVVEKSKVYTNQQIINAYYNVYGESEYWNEMAKAGLEFLANDRMGVFNAEEKLPESIKNYLTKG